jgi:DNA polymerase III sliding clamp (beta) subunit (PCNA family)
VKANLLSLAEMEADDPELVPEILPVDARLSIKGSVSKFQTLFERAAAVTPTKEIVVGTLYALLEGAAATIQAVSHARITASDGELTISVVVDGVQIARAGSVLLPAKKMLDCLKLCPEPMVKIEVIGLTAHVTSGRAHWSIQAVSGDSLPPLANVDDTPLHPIPREAFLEALVVARRAVSTAFRPAMMQASIEQGAITSSDGARLLRQQIPGIPKDLSLTIPVKVIDELTKALRRFEDDTFEMGVDPQHLVFRFGNDSIIARRLLLGFPNLENLLLEPAFSNIHMLTVAKKDLLAVIQRVRINADPDYAAIWLSLIPGPKEDGVTTFTLAVRARDSLNNAAQEIMDCTFDGPAKAKELCVNHKYLTDMLESYQGDTPVFRLGIDTKSSRMPLFIEDAETGFSGIVNQMRADFMK